MAGLLNSSLPLQPAYVRSDFRYVFWGHSHDLRHVPEVPMVGPDSPGGRHLKGSIAMVVWFVDLMDKRRTLIRAYRPLAVTSCTIGLEFGFALLKFLWGRKGVSL